MDHPTMAARPATPPDQRNQHVSPPSGRTLPLSALCDGDRHALHPGVRARFTVAAAEYAASPTRDVVVVPIPPGDGTGLWWTDSGDIGIVGAYNPALLTRALALTVIERQSGKTLVDIDTPVGGAR
jgi:hypothetical protein